MLKLKAFAIDKDKKKLARLALKKILKGETKGSEYTGWLDLPREYKEEDIENIENTAEKIRNNSDVLICIGIGGSYLGTKSLIEGLKPYFRKEKTEIIFAGHQLSTVYLKELKEYIQNKEFSVNIISKSGTTLEPALVFRVINSLMKEKYSESQIRERLFITTDKKSGSLRKLADEKEYESFIVPDNIGGRYSYLTAVGLLPLAVANIDIRELIKGANLALDDFTSEDNLAIDYAALRSQYYKDGKDIEILAFYEEKLIMVGEWFKQLFGESEGKDGKGIFPTSMLFTRDLHSMGQWIQEGPRNIFETILTIEEYDEDILIPRDEKNYDGLNYLSDRSLNEIIKKIKSGVVKAHEEGEVPNIEISLKELSAKSLSYLFYFFMISCGISANLLGVNPFDQPGVEAYKEAVYKELKNEPIN